MVWDVVTRCAMKLLTEQLVSVVEAAGLVADRAGGRGHSHHFLTLRPLRVRPSGSARFDSSIRVMKPSTKRSP